MKINVLSLFLIFVSPVTILAGSGNEENKKESENSENKQKKNRFSRFSNFKLKTNGTNLRKRRATTYTGAFSVGHQYFSRNFQLAESDVCSVQNNNLLVTEFHCGSAHLKTTKSSCQLLLNADTEGVWIERKGFAIGGDTGSNTIFDRKLGAYDETVTVKKVEHDLNIALTSGGVDLILSALYDCDDSAAFSCGESMCISQAAMCDGIQNCKDGSDEDGWRCGALGNSKLLTFIAFLILGLIILVPFFLVRRFKKKKMATISRSRISRTSNSSSR